MKVVRYLFFLLLILTQANLFAANADSVKKKEPKITPVVKYITLDDFNRTNPIKELQKIDTALSGIEVFNPAFQKSYHYLGNLGSASAPTIFSPNNYFGTDVGYHGYDLFFFRPEDIKYYRTNTPYTELNYNLCSNSEQFLKIIHTQNIGERFNVGLNYNRIASLGYFQNQNTSMSNFDFFMWYNSKNQRYNLLVSGTWNHVNNQENGGLPSAYTDTVFNKFYKSNLDKATLPVNMNQPTDETTFRDKVFNVRQFYDFGFKKNLQVNDTTVVKKFIPTQRISYSINYHTNSYIYQDSIPDSGFYNLYYYNLNGTYDSTHYYKIENKISWATLGNKNNETDSIRHILYTFSLAHQYLSYQQFENTLDIVDETTDNAMAGFDIRNNPEKSQFHWQGGGDYYFYGTNKGNYNTHINLLSGYENIYYIGIGIDRRLYAPELIDNRYESNHFIWFNNFTNTLSNSARFDFGMPKWHFYVSLNYYTLSNYIYFDSLALPAQSSTQINILQLDVTKNFVWGNFHFNNHFVYQKVSGNDVIHLPEFLSINSFYYEHRFFKKALQMQFGTDFRYNTAYYSDAYMPATGQFYLQNSEKTGNYPLLDLFINFRIKTVRIFVRGENMLDAITPATNYSLVPYYPMPGRSLKFGIIWQFFD